MAKGNRKATKASTSSGSHQEPPKVEPPLPVLKPVGETTTLIGTSTYTEIPKVVTVTPGAPQTVTLSLGHDHVVEDELRREIERLKTEIDSLKAEAGRANAQAQGHMIDNERLQKEMQNLRVAMARGIPVSAPALVPEVRPLPPPPDEFSVLVEVMVNRYEIDKKIYLKGEKFRLPKDKIRGNTSVKVV